MTAEERQYLKRAVDARRRLILAQAGDRKFRHQAQASPEDRDGQIQALLAVVMLAGMTVLMTLALLVERHFS